MPLPLSCRPAYMPNFLTVAPRASSVMDARNALSPSTLPQLFWNWAGKQLYQASLVQNGQHHEKRPKPCTNCTSQLQQPYQDHFVHLEIHKVFCKPCKTLQNHAKPQMAEVVWWFLYRLAFRKWICMNMPWSIQLSSQKMQRPGTKFRQILLANLTL